MNFGQTVIFLSEGNSLKELKLHFVRDINVPKFTRQLGVFSFRAFLNIGMLLTESERAKQLCTRILDIIIATMWHQGYAFVAVFLLLSHSIWGNGI